ncbi:hypothetical protein HZC07_01020 [Candidatus Micrarchaeota archaeon]|nr:hypothetical protein [Candidatus Micrarchaeota archaeon]
MASTFIKILILILSIGIGIGITLFGTSLINPIYPIDQQTQIIIAIVLIIFLYIAFYFMTKGSGN